MESADQASPDEPTTKLDKLSNCNLDISRRYTVWVMKLYRDTVPYGNLLNPLGKLHLHARM